MNWLSTLCRNCIAKLWMVGIVVLIIIALAVSAIRGALPYVNEYQPQLSQILHEKYNINLKMGSVKGFWHDGGPLLVIDDLSFDNQATLGLNIDVKQAKLHLDIVQSILALTPRFKLISVESPTLFIDKLPHLSSSKKPAQEDFLTPLLHITQSALITQATVEFSDYYGTLPSIDVARIAWHDAIEQRQLQVLLTSDNKQHQPLKLIVDLHGNSQSALRGQVYIKAHNWHWLDNLKPMLPQLSASASARASFEMWADFSAGHLDAMLLKLEENELTWFVNSKEQRLSFCPELVQWLPHQQGWVFEAKDIRPSFNGQTLSPIQLYAHQNADVLSLSVDALNIAEFSPLSSLLSRVDNDSAHFISQLAMTGSLQDIKIKHDSSGWHYQGELNAFSMDNVGGIPSIESLSGTFNGDGTTGQIELQATNQSLDFGQYFKEPIAITALNSTIKWHTSANTFIVQSPATHFVNNDARSTIAWKIEAPSNGSPTLSLLGDGEIFNAKNTQYYLPHVVLSNGLVDYLSGAIKAGESDNIQLLWQGALDKFPYQDSDGIFEVTASVNNAAFEFHEDWKPLTKASVELYFKNETMHITGIKGQLENLTFESLTTAIDDLMAPLPVLSISAKIKQPQSKINKFVFSSPIDDSLGPVLRQLDVKGDITTLLNISLPLDGSLPNISGTVNLKNNDLSIKAIDLDINKLTGNVEFLGGDITAQNLQGILYQQPVTLELNSKPVGDFYGVEVDLNAQWHTNKMPQTWQQHLNQYIDGRLDWAGKLTLKINDDDVYYQSFVKSPMTGLQLKLPKPLDKYVDQHEDLLITSNGNIAGGLFNLALGSRAEAFARIDTTQSEVKIPALTLLVGRKFQAKDDIADDGMMINIDLDTLALDEWQSFIDGIEKGQSEDAFFPVLNKINARVKSLSVLGQTFDNVELGGVKAIDHWQVNVDSVQASGSLKLFDQWFGKGIEADFEHLILSKSDTSNNDKSATRESLRNLPPLTFNCRQCQVLTAKLGQVSFNTKSHLQGMSIDNIKVEANDTKLNASAIWGFDAQGEYSAIEGSITGDNIESTLAMLDYTSSIRDSNVKTDFDLTWRSSLYAPDIETLEGLIDWKLGEGHIAEVSDQGARIFSLFSLDSLRRKLVLDFRDVFQKGIFFNDFKGAFAIKDGVAVTQNAHMDGVAGGVDVIGSVNLSTTELDYYISFSPALFSNLPVIAGVVASEPQMFVLTFALTKVLEPIVDVISQVNFKLSGTVDKPDFIEIDRKQKKYKVPPHILEKLPKSPTKEPTLEGVNIPNEQSKTDIGTASL